MMPVERGRENAASGVFFTVPARVAMNTKCCSSYCFTGSRALIFSPSLERQQVHHRLAARAAPGLGQLVDLEPVHLAAVGEAQHRVVGVGDEQLLDEVLVLDRGGGLAAPAAPLRLVFGERLALGIAGVRKRHHHVLRLDQVLGGQIEVIAVDLGAAGIAVGCRAPRAARRAPPACRRSGRARMSVRSRMLSSSSRYSSMILSCSSPVRRCRRMSRIAWACASESR